MVLCVLSSVVQKVIEDQVGSARAVCLARASAAVRSSGHDDHRDVCRVRRARGARRVARVRAPVIRGVAGRRDPGLASRASADEAATEPAVRRRTVPRRPGRRPGGVSRVHGGELAGDRGGDARPGYADERGRAVCRTAAGACRAAAAARAAGGRRVRRAVPIPRPVRLPLRRPPGRLRRTGPRVCGDWSGAADRRTRGGVASWPGSEPAGRNRPGGPRVARRLIWPEHAHRRSRLRAATAVAAAEPPLLVRGDLVDDLPALAAQAPADATLVVFHTSLMFYVPAPRRKAFVEVVRGLPGHWIANKARTCCPTMRCRSHRPRRCTTCLRWTGRRSPGPGRTGRRSPGSPKCFQQMLYFGRRIGSQWLHAAKSRTPVPMRSLSRSTSLP